MHRYAGSSFPPANSALYAPRALRSIADGALPPQNCNEELHNKLEQCRRAAVNDFLPNRELFMFHSIQTMVRVPTSCPPCPCCTPLSPPAKRTSARGAHTVPTRVAYGAESDAYGVRHPNLGWCEHGCCRHACRAHGRLEPECVNVLWLRCHRRHTLAGCVGGCAVDPECE